MADVNVKHEPEQNRYVGFVDGEEAGFARYSTADSVRSFFSTVTHSGFTGQGVAAAVVKYALDDSIASGYSLTPACSYVEHFIHKHPAYREHIA